MRKSTSGLILQRRGCFFIVKNFVDKETKLGYYFVDKETIKLLEGEFKC